MALESTDNALERKKQPNAIRRDQRLFGSRRPGPGLQQAPDFLTDSLNTTHIPSPSPQKSTTRRDLRARPRQAWERKSLAASSNTTPQRNKENEKPHDPLKSMSEDAETRRRSLPLRAESQPKPLSPVLSPSVTTRTRTPSPPRGRRNTIDSPANSESSPPHGYAEAYQRIVEESNLTDSIDDMEPESFNHSEETASQQSGRLPPHSRHQSLSPTSLKSSRKLSPRSVISLDPRIEERAGYLDESALKEVMSDPGVDNTEDSIDSGSSQYARDLHRLKSALNGGTKAFSKARLGERPGLTVENLRRRTGSNDSLRGSPSASTPSRYSDPSYNVPKAWGRKAKPDKEWFKKINGRAERLEEHSPKSRSASEDKVGSLWQDRIEPAVEWAATASEIPLPESSSLAESLQGSNTPRTSAQHAPPMELGKDWRFHDDDFTGRSLQVSESPPIHIRRLVAERLRDEEIEKLEKKGVTTSRLGELKEKVSFGTLRRKALGKTSPEKALEKEYLSPGDPKSPEQLSQENPKSPEHSSQDPKHEEDVSVTDYLGEAIPDTPVVIYKNGAPRDSKTDDVRRPGKERQESHELLRRLAKAASESPTPPKVKAGSEDVNAQETSQQEVEQKSPQSQHQLGNKTPVVTGAWIDQTLDSLPTLPRPSSKTPKVTGAWIDTPMPVRSKEEAVLRATGHEPLSQSKAAATETTQGSEPHTSKPIRRSLPYTGPALPKSALSEILEEIKAGKPGHAERGSDSEDDVTFQLGNSTIQSLEDLVEHDTDHSTLLAPTPPSQETSPPSSDPSPTSCLPTVNDSKVSGDPNAYADLLSRLTHLGPSLRASKRQIASLERTVASQDKRTIEECNEAGEFHDFIWPCQRCGCVGGTPRRESAPAPTLPSLITIRNGLEASTTTVSIPIPRLWNWKRDDWRPRLTWLGVAVLSVYVYFFFEIWAQDVFCHPLYASHMIGYGVDLNAPEPPFVLFKVICSRIASFLFPPNANNIGSNSNNLLYISIRTIIRTISTVFGYVAGFFIEAVASTLGAGAGAGVGNTAASWRQPVSRDTRIPRPKWGPDLSLLDDEYL